MTVQWQKVHVFISSTFNDMHAERDYLVKRVFPELQDWCERRKLRLVDVDLRWGVTEADATANANVVRTCLKRIDDCRPFFVCLLGQRYGWAPEPKDVSPETLTEYPLLRAALDEGVSVTEMEIRHAIVEPFRATPEDKADDEHFRLAEHSFFYLRDPDYVPAIPTDPPALRRTYTDEAEEDPVKRAVLVEQLRVLRDVKIPATGRPIRHYRATWDGDAYTPEIALPPACPALLDANVVRWRGEWEKVLGPGGVVTGRELPEEQRDAADAYNARLTRGRLAPFARADGEGADEDLAAAILRDLKTAIQARYPDHVEFEHATALQRELDQHEQFLFLSSEGFIERGDDFAELDKYVAGDSNKLFVLTAEGGMGKSMLLANWIDRCRREPDRHPGATFHVRFIGQSDGSASVTGLLRFLLEEMQDVAGKLPRTTTETRTDPDGGTREVEVPFEIPADPREIRRFWQEQLPRLGEQGRTVIVVDAINQLEGGLRDTNWLPLQGLPAGVKLIASFRCGGDETESEALKERLGRHPHVQMASVDPFDDEEDRKKLVATYLDQYLKELDEQHVEQIIHAEGAANPLYLKVVLSELRVFGSFMGLREKIEHDFGDTPVSAFGAVLQRLEEDPSYTAVNPAAAVPLLFGLLLHTRRGLSAGELADLFVAEAGLKLKPEERAVAEEEVQLLLRQVRAFLGRRDGLHSYFFESFQLAARVRYVVGGKDTAGAEREATGWHGALARYFAGQPLFLEDDDSRVANRRKMDELAYQQAGAQAWVGVRGTLTGFDFIHAKLKWLGYEALAEDFDIALTCGYSDRDLALVQNALTLGASALRADDRQLPVQLVGRLMLADEPSIVALVTQAKERPDWPWLQPIGPTLIQAGGPLRHTLEGHTSWVYSVAVSPDGRRVVSSSHDHTVRVWDPETGTLLHTLDGHTSSVQSVAVSPDGRRALSGSDDKTVRLWDLETGTLLHTLDGHTSGVQSVAVSPDGRWAVSGSADGRLCLWDLETGTLLHSIEGHEVSVNAVAVSPDGRWAVSGSDDRRLRMWDLETGTLLHTLEGATGRVMSIAMSPDGRWVASGSDNSFTKPGTACVWDLETRTLRHTLEGHTGGVMSVAVNPDGRRVVSGSGDRTLRVWDLETGALLHTLEGHTSGVQSVAVSPDGRWAVSGSGDKTVRVWDLEFGESVRIGDGHSDRVRCVAVSPDGRQAVSGSDDSTVRAWDLHTGTSHQILEGHTNWVWSVAVSPDGRWAVSGSQDTTVRVWDLETGTLLHTLKGHRSSVGSVSVSPDGRRVVSGSGDKTLRVWDLETGTLLHRLEGHTGSVNSVATSPDGQWAVSGSQDTTVRVWDLETGTSRHTLDGHTGWVICVAVSPDGRRVVSGSCDYTVRVWDLEAGTLLHTLEGHRDHVLSVAVSPDGRRALSGSDIFSSKSKHGTVCAWDLETGTLLHRLEGHTGAVNSVATSPDGQWAVSGSDDKTLRVWDLETGFEIALFSVDAPLLGMAVGSKSIVAGDDGGKVHSLCLNGVEIGPPIVTAATPRARSRAGDRPGEDALEAQCPSCCSMLDVTPSQLSHEITCTYCDALLKLNPFFGHQFDAPSGISSRPSRAWLSRLLGRR